MEVHRRVGVLEIALDAQTQKLFRLDLDPVAGELAAFLTELVDRDLVLVLAFGAVLFLDLPFDRKAMAVPAGHIVGIIAAHLEGARDDVLQNLVQRMTDMDVAIGIGRAVMQHEFFAPRRVLAQEAVEVHLLPAGDDLGLLLREAGAHGKLGLRQVEGLGIVDLFGRIGHFIAVRWAKRRRASP